MKEIVENLWITDYRTIYGTGNLLHHLNTFDKIVTVAQELDYIFKDINEIQEHKAMIFPLEDGEWDHPAANERIFVHAINYVAILLKRGDKVVVHCWAGISRSASVVMGALMKMGMSYDEADKHFRKVYPQGDPDPFFLRILRSMDFSAV